MNLKPDMTNDEILAAARRLSEARELLRFAEEHIQAGRVVEARTDVLSAQVRLDVLVPR